METASPGREWEMGVVAGQPGKGILLSTQEAADPGTDTQPSLGPYGGDLGGHTGPACGVHGQEKSPQGKNSESWLLLPQHQGRSPWNFLDSGHVSCLDLTSGGIALQALESSTVFLSHHNKS